MLIWDEDSVATHDAIWERVAAAIRSYLERYRKLLGAW